MKKALITGISGFIASETARQLMQAGVEVVGLDNMNDYYDPRLKQHRLDVLRREFEFEFHQLDIENHEGLDRIFRAHKFEAVFNLAGRAGVRHSLVDPRVYFSTNMMGTLNLLESMREHGVPKIVLASTSSLYAGESLPFSEQAPVNQPISPYAASKKAAEQICYTYGFHYGLDCTVVRYFTVYGPAGRPDMSIFRFIKWVDEGQPLIIYGDGEQSRDFTYVGDIAKGTILAARPFGYEIINLGGGREPVTLKQVIRWIEEGLGKTAKVVHKPAQKADLTDTQADIGKAKRLLEWVPQTGFQEGLQRSIAWYLENRTLVSRLDLGN
jgi:UDP-glucuronate 4-epimerase